MSATTTNFIQPCPVCSRSLQVPVQLLGKEAACQHCGASFVTSDASYHGAAVMEQADALLSSRVPIQSQKPLIVEPHAVTPGTEPRW